MAIDPTTSGFTPLHLFMAPDGSFTDPDLALACLEWANTLAGE
jgi:hypothetical protein